MKYIVLKEVKPNQDRKIIFESDSKAEALEVMQNEINLMLASKPYKVKNVIREAYNHYLLKEDNSPIMTEFTIIIEY